jgi:hypothetical protein
MAGSLSDAMAGSLQVNGWTVLTVAAAVRANIFSRQSNLLIHPVF